MILIRRILEDAVRKTDRTIGTLVEGGQDEFRAEGRQDGTALHATGFNFRRPGNIPIDYRIALTARESTPPNPMIAVSSNNQTIGVILEFMRHLLIGFVCRQTGMHTVYKKRGEKQAVFPVPVNALRMRKGSVSRFTYRVRRGTDRLVYAICDVGVVVCIVKIGHRKKICG